MAASLTIILSQLSNNYPLLMPVAFKKATGISCSSCPIISDPFIDVSCCLSQCQKVAASRLRSRKGFRTFLFFGPHNQQKIKSKEFLNSSVNTEASAQISPFAYKIRVCLQFISQEVGGGAPRQIDFHVVVHKQTTFVVFGFSQERRRRLGSSFDFGNRQIENSTHPMQPRYNFLLLHLFRRTCSSRRREDESEQATTSIKGHHLKSALITTGEYSPTPAYTHIIQYAVIIV